VDAGVRIAIDLGPKSVKDLSLGASVAVDGVCLTVSAIQGHTAYFDVIPESLSRTSLGKLQVGDLVNIERSLCLGAEIGGHLLSGHIMGQASIAQIEHRDASYIMHLSVPQDWMAWIFPKGYIALDGASLTVVDVYPEGRFTVHLIPETLRLTGLGDKREGDAVNIEIDSQTQVIVATVERVLAQRERRE
jgi:riboflavin synthase